MTTEEERRSKQEENAKMTRTLERGDKARERSSQHPQTQMDVLKCKTESTIEEKKLLIPCVLDLC